MSKAGATLPLPAVVSLIKVEVDALVILARPNQEILTCLDLHSLELRLADFAKNAMENASFAILMSGDQ